MLFQDRTVTFSKAELRALIAHASDDTTRPHINAIYFDARAKEVAAADGHRLAVCAAEGEPSTWEYLLSREVAERCAKHPGAESYRLDTAAGVVHLIGKVPRHGGEPPAIGTAPAPDAHLNEKGEKENTFPPFRQVMSKPVYRRGIVTGFNAAYLADLLLVARAANERTCGVLVIPPNEQLDPGRFVCGAWTIIIMPMRLAMDDSDPVILANTTPAPREPPRTAPPPLPPAPPQEPPPPPVVDERARVLAALAAELPKLPDDTLLGLAYGWLPASVPCVGLTSQDLVRRLTTWARKQSLAALQDFRGAVAAALTPHAA